MLIAVDIGNSNIVAGIFNRENLVTSFRISTVRSRTSDEYGAILTELIRSNEIMSGDISGAIISCVVPSLTEIIYQSISVYLDIEPLVVSADIKTDLVFLCNNPDEIGGDRIANAVAAQRKFRCGSIIVDFGTATTFDCVSGNSEFLGGVIAPGFNTSAEALYTNAPGLPRIEYTKPQNVVGRNTRDCIRSGIVLGYLSMVDGMIERIMTELKDDVKIVATGGLAHTVCRESRYIEEIDDFLTLRGLREIFELNV